MHDPEPERRVHFAGTVAGLGGDARGDLEMIERRRELVAQQVRSAEPGPGGELAPAVADRDRRLAGLVEAAGRLVVPALGQPDVAQAGPGADLAGPIAEVGGDVQGLGEESGGLVVPGPLMMQEAEAGQVVQLAAAVTQVAGELQRLLRDSSPEPADQEAKVNPLALRLPGEHLTGQRSPGLHFGE